MPSKSKTKGSNGERELCKILSEELGGSFIRVPTSGAMIGGQNNFRAKAMSDTQVKIFRGDIIPPDHLPKIVIECKSYKDFRFHQLLQPGSCPILDEWIRQTVDIIKEEDKWFVMFKINLIGWYVAIPENSCDNYIFDNFGKYKSPFGNVVITSLVNFLKSNKDEIIKKCS